GGWRGLENPRSEATAGENPPARRVPQGPAGGRLRCRFSSRQVRGPSARRPSGLENHRADWARKPPDAAASTEPAGEPVRGEGGWPAVSASARDGLEPLIFEGT